MEEEPTEKKASNAFGMIFGLDCFNEDSISAPEADRLVDAVNLPARFIPVLEVSEPSALTVRGFLSRSEHHPFTPVSRV